MSERDDGQDFRAEARRIGVSRVHMPSKQPLLFDDRPRGLCGHITDRLSRDRKAVTCLSCRKAIDAAIKATEARR